MPEERESVAGDTEPPRYARRSSVRVEQALVGSLWLAYIPVAFLLLAALGAFVYGVAVFINAFSGILHHPFPVGHHIGLFLLDFDLFLIGATALISAIGFYELFIADIDRRQAGLLPRWLAMNDLNELKARSSRWWYSCWPWRSPRRPLIPPMACTSWNSAAPSRWSSSR